jgi:hypothetical protein
LTLSEFEANGQSTAKRMRSTPISSMQQRGAESEKNLLVVMRKFDGALSAPYTSIDILEVSGTKQVIFSRAGW